MQDPTFSTYKPFFWVCTFFFLGTGIYTLFWSRKDLQDYYQVTGPVTKIYNRHADLPYDDDPRQKYIEVQGFDRAFSVGGQEPEDITPEMQSLEKLNTGDTITVYYDEKPFFVSDKEEYRNIVSFTQRVYKGKQLHYNRGKVDANLGKFLLITGSLLGCFLFFYKGK